MSSFKSRLSYAFGLGSIALMSAIATAQPTQAADFTTQVDPKATYLRHLFDEPLAQDAVAIDLSSFSISPGDFITLESLGDFSYWANPARPETATGLFGVFSSSAELLPSSFLNRVTGAIEAGQDVQTTSPDLLAAGFTSNDIAEDFLVRDQPLRIQVPDLASFLFVAAPDRYWGDNRDPDGDFALKITTEEQEKVPEPFSLVGMSLALGASALLCRKR